MKTIVPPRLKKGDEIRVIAPSRSLGILAETQVAETVKKLGNEGFKVTFGKHVKEKDQFFSSSVNSRVSDINDAFRDKNVKVILTAIGGFNSNQLLPYLDYALIQKNPKILCGYSDITALSNAIYAKTGVVGYCGAHFSTFGMKKGNGYTQEYFTRCLTNSKPFDVLPSKEWSDDAWYLDQEKRKFIKNEGWWVINRGTAQGTIVGGNLCTFQLLHGTEYLPSLKDAILFVEDDEESGPTFALNFDRDLQSILQQKGARIKALIIGRCQKSVKMTREILTAIIKSKKELDGIPVIANVDFGHTSPIITYPVGGTAKITASKGKAAIRILTH